MTAGVANRLWTFEELFDRVMGDGQAMAAQNLTVFLDFLRRDVM
jgi:hypothetical protein